jgi:hypothetical protein
MRIAYHYNEIAGANVPCCPRFPASHHISAERGGYYCYECAEHYDEKMKGEKTCECIKSGK